MLLCVKVHRRKKERKCSEPQRMTLEIVFPGPSYDEVIRVDST